MPTFRYSEASLIHRAVIVFKKSRHHLPRSSCSKAICCGLSNSNFLVHGCVAIDSNLVENSIFYTIIEFCRRRGINPFD